MAAILNAWPWRILRGVLSVRYPGKAWCNAVTRALVTMEIRTGKPGEPMHIERPNSNGSNWKIVIPPDVVGGSSLFTFACRVGVYEDDPVVVVAEGWVNHGQSVFYVAESNVVVPETAGAYWIYHSLYRESGTWTNAMICTADGTYPTPDSTEYITVLRGVTRNADGTLTLFEIANHAGDIKIDGAFAP